MPLRTFLLVSVVFNASLLRVPYGLAGPIEDAVRSVVLIRTPSGLGTGFVVGGGTLVATNFHVIEGATEAHAEFQDGSSIAFIGFRIASPEYDLAILELPNNAPAAALRLSDDLPDIGTDVFAIGSPKGLAGSVSKGVISAYRRWSELGPLMKDRLHSFGYSLDGRWVQTDAAINSGNSGGPLVLSTGEVIGINTLAAPPSVGQSINFAVLASHLAQFLDAMPDKSLSFDALPPAKRPANDDHKERGSADNTADYWAAVANVNGGYEVECQKLRIKHGFFKVRRRADPVGNAKVGMADERFGKTPRERQSRISRMAGDAGLTIAEAKEMDFDSLSMAVTDKRLKEEADRRRLVKAKGLGPLAYQNELMRQLGGGRDAEKKIKDFDEALAGLAIAAARAATSLDAIPTDSVHPALIEYSITLATAYRKLSLSTGRARTAVKLIATGGSQRDAELAEAGMKEDRADLLNLRDVTGAEMRVRLQNLFGRDFEPYTAAPPPDQLHLFEGEENLPGRP